METFRRDWVIADVLPHILHMRLRDLTIADMTQTPLWRHDGGDDDTAEVFPAVDFVDVDRVGYIAATRFMTADGTALIGFCSPQDPPGMDYVQPVVIANGGHIRLWHDDPIPDEQLDATLALLGKQRSQVFPLQCRCLVPFE